MGFLDGLKYENNKIKHPYIKYVKYQGHCDDVYMSFELTCRWYNQYDRHPNSDISLEFYINLGKEEGSVSAKVKPNLFLDGLLELCNELKNLPTPPEKVEKVTSRLTYGYVGMIKKVYSWNGNKHGNTLLGAIDILLENVFLVAISVEDDDVFSEYSKTIKPKQHSAGKTRV